MSLAPFAVLTHGGAASPSRHKDGCERAAEAARALLAGGASALEAAIAATAMLEDDPRFNAGTGSNLRFDGVTIEMDAAIMTSDGAFGSVACVERVKNPILVAARVRESPHLMLAGAGATALARAMGLPEHDVATEGARQKHARTLLELAGAGDGVYAEDAAPWRADRAARPEAFWNFPGAAPEAAALPVAPDCDTVGAVVRDARGAFAATASTGGTLYMLRGRVGDSPLMGCGVYAGPAGAVAATGVGEEIVRRFLSKTVYDWLAAGVPAAEAAARGVALFPDAIDLGLLVADRAGEAAASNRDMACAIVRGA